MMWRLGLALVLVTTGTSSAFALPQRFDLVCTSLPAHPGDFVGKDLYSLDFGSMRWCNSTCTDPYSMHRQGTTVLMYYSNLPAAGTLLSLKLDLARLTTSEIVQSSPGHTEVLREQCRLARFSGIHARPEPF